ncbi:hypothetical protein JQ627_20115 [Bradyrhizobium liaoningense]|nr:hypothetical protein [Bradyrhizobium liaoningense]
MIDGPESADAVAAEIMKTPVRRGSSISISGATNFALRGPDRRSRWFRCRGIQADPDCPRPFPCRRRSRRRSETSDRPEGQPGSPRATFMNLAWAPWPLAPNVIEPSSHICVQPPLH